MIELIVCGATGRMGQRVCALAEDDVRYHATRCLRDVATHDTQTKTPRVIVDFSSDSGAREAADCASRLACPLLVATTGLTAKTIDVLDKTARSQAVMIAPNTSRGVAVMTKLVSDAARLLGATYQRDLTEQHHRHKRDAPSGTALRLMSAMERSGHPIGPDRVHCVRAGEIIGEHEVQFSGDREILKISHSAANRDVFAAGALDAAAWLVDQPAGLYGVEDWLQLSP